MPWFETTTQGLKQVFYSSCPEPMCLGTPKLPTISHETPPDLSSAIPTLPCLGERDSRTAQQLQEAAVRDHLSAVDIAKHFPRSAFGLGHTFRKSHHVLVSHSMSSLRTSMVTKAMSSGVKTFHSAELGQAQAPSHQQTAELRTMSDDLLGMAISPEESVGGSRKPNPPRLST